MRNRYPLPSGSWHRNFKYASRNICGTMAEKDTMITTRATLPRFTKSSIRVCSLQLPITELSHFRYLVAVDIVVGDRSNRSETLSLRLEAMVIVIKERKGDPGASFRVLTRLLVSCQTRGVSRQASTTRWFQSSIWRIFSANESFLRSARICAERNKHFDINENTSN